MTIERSWTLKDITDKAIEYISNISAANLGADFAPATMNMEQGHTWKTGSVGTKANAWTAQTYYAYVKTTTAIPAKLLTAVPTTTPAAQFASLLSNRKLTQENFAGKVVSVRTMQAVIDTMVQFIMARYQIWMTPDASKTVVLYDSGSVSYSSMNYNYDFVDYRDKVTKDSLDELIGSVVNASLASSKVNRQGLELTHTSSSSSSSCSSSSCSSSSCSSSCSSSSCSSSSSSCIFIAFMNLHTM